MDTKLLKQKILDLAIHGKLVPQNPNDEPASKLLEKIREEKQKLIAEKKIKADKNDSYIFVGDDNRHYEKFADGTVKDIEDEIPFEVPEGWAWTKIRCVSSEILYGVSESAKESGKYRLLRITDIQDDKVNWESVPFTDFPEDKVANYILKNGDIVFARTGATVGKSYLIENLSVESIYASYLIRIRTSQLLNPKYVKYFFGSLCYWNQITDKSSGIGQPNVNGTSLANLYIPIPPYNEQEQILPAIERAFALIDSLENDKEVLQTIIIQAKSKILDLAIHGKLVPQDESDEPASMLLERLRAEKEAKIKAGELKRDKNDSYIYKNTTDNCYYQKFADGSEEQADITFEIPSNWTWCCLGEVSTKIKRGKSPIYTEKSSIMAFAQKCNQKDGPTTLEKALYIDEATLKKYPEEEKMQVNDIVINSTGTGTLGRVGIFDCSIPDGVVAVYPDSHVSSVRINPQLFAKYFYYFVKNKQSYLEEMGEGSTNQKELKIDTISNLIVPLPPLSEQKRIVEKIEKLYSFLDKIAENLI